MTLYRALDDLSGAELALTGLAEVAFAEGYSARAEQLFDECGTVVAAVTEQLLPVAPRIRAGAVRTTVQRVVAPAAFQVVVALLAVHHVRARVAPLGGAGISGRMSERRSLPEPPW